MKLNFLLYTTICIFITGCVETQNCVDNINKLPMYGNVTKCTGQINADKKFLAQCDKDFKNRKDAAKHIVMRGWQYFDDKKLDTSMMRFNQAWLLDSLNSDIYWGFGNLLGLQGKYEESIPFFRKSLKLNSSNSKVWEDMSISYGNIFFKTRNVKFLQSAIDATKKAISLDTHNPRFYAELTACYSYFTHRDSARKYLKITDQLDPSAINPEVRRFLNKNNNTNVN